MALTIESGLNWLHCIGIGHSSFSMCGTSYLAWMMHVRAIDAFVIIMAFGNLIDFAVCNVDVKGVQVGCPLFGAQRNINSVLRSQNH